MPVWLYALTAAPLPERPPRGAAGEALFAFELSPAAAEASPAGAPLFAVAGEMAAPLPPSEASLRAHDGTVRALADLLDPLLPVRFGQTAAAAADLAALLAPRRAALVAALREVAGCVQVTLRFPSRAEPPGEPPPADDTLTEPSTDTAEPSPLIGPGTRYLHARRDSARAAAEPPPSARCLLARLAPLVRAQRVAAARPPYAAAVYHLVERRRLAEYRAALAAAVAAATDPPPLASGPWPAWAFAPGLVE